MVQGQIGTCRYLLANGKVCGCKLMKRYMWDYYFCPKCHPQGVKDNIRDLFQVEKIRKRRGYI